MSIFSFDGRACLCYTLRMDLDALKQSLEPYRRYRKLEGKGNHYSAHCPFHSDASPSLDVDRKPNGAWVWVCRSGDTPRCKAGGSIIDLVAGMRNLTHADAIRELTNGVDGPTPQNGQAEAPPPKTEFKATEDEHVIPREKALAESVAARDYLTGRGITEGVWQALRFGYKAQQYFRGTKCKAGPCSLCGKYPAIVVPLFWDGKLIGVKYRAIKPPDKWHRFAQEKGSESDFLYNADAGHRHSTPARGNPFSQVVFYVEGEMDCALVLSLGFNGVAGIGVSSVPFPDKQSERFRESVQKVKNDYDRMVTIGDMDQTGQAACQRMTGIFGGMGIVGGHFPADKTKPTLAVDGRTLYPRFKDITDFCQANGKDAAREFLSWHVEHVENEDHHYSTFRGSEAHKLRRILDKASCRVFEVEPKILIQSVQQDVQRLLPPEAGFPSPLTERSLFGIVGDFVKTGIPTVNSDEACIAYQFLGAVGNAFGRTIYGIFSKGKHYPALFPFIVGDTTAGKGQAGDLVEALAELIDPEWFENNWRTSTASGEGLVRMLHEQVHPDEESNKKSDPRMVIMQGEMSVLLNNSNRQGSTTSGYLRSAWEFKALENNRSQEQFRVKPEDYFLTMIGHITPHELSKVLSKVDWYDGMANRLLWAGVRAKQRLTRSTKSPDFTDIAERLKRLLSLPAVGFVDYSEEGGKVWDDWMNSQPPMEGELESGCRRLAPYALRLAVLYVALDERRLGSWKPEIESVHVNAATELVDRSRESMKWFLERPVKVTAKEADWDNIIKFRAALNEKGRLTGTELKEDLFPHTSVEERRDIASRAGAKFRPGPMGAPGSGVWTW
jgi:hypothetical protein